ncbi:MAG: trypsin-like peptidase domain-containing protein, partial [Clostridia bacterium]|nr:trypsin-like peptidase domain-containing protein [Clostridia bacterium]
MMFRKDSMKRKSLVMAVILTIAMLSTSCTMKKEDDNPPSAPLLTVTSVTKDSVTLAWSESYDNEGIDGYKLYKDGDVVKELSKTEYKDTEVKEGKEYEYYVVAYDEAGNRSSKSVKQRVKVADSSTSTDGPTNSKLDMQKLSRSTIKLYTLDNDLNIIAMGSGTIINKQGYILTNFHCVGNEDGSLANKDGYVAIALTDDIKKNIQPQYIAQYRSGVQPLDIAVVKIVSDLNWNEVSPEDLNLVPAKLGDSEKIKMGDDINILGYPGVGGETITFTAGRVSGFIDDNADDETDWIKTDAIVNHGNSGGTAINQKGEMIGIPSAKIPGQDQDIMFLLKPINQAKPIIEDAMSQGDNPEPVSYTHLRAHE